MTEEEEEGSIRGNNGTLYCKAYQGPRSPGKTGCAYTRKECTNGEHKCLGCGNKGHGKADCWKGRVDPPPPPSSSVPSNKRLLGPSGKGDREVRPRVTAGAELLSGVPNLHGAAPAEDWQPVRDLLCNALSSWGYGPDYLEPTQVLWWMGPRWVAFKPGAKCVHEAQPCKDVFKNGPGEDDWVLIGQYGTGWHGTSLTNVLSILVNRGRLRPGPRGRVSGIYHSEQMKTGKGYMKQDDVVYWFQGCEIVIEGALLELKVGGLVRYDSERKDGNDQYIPMDRGKLARWKSSGTVQSVSHTEQISLRRVFFKFRKDQKELFESSKEAIRRID